MSAIIGIFAGYFPVLLMDLLNHFVAALAFVLAGCYVAPKQKIVTSIVLAILTAIMICFIFIGSMISGRLSWDLAASLILTATGTVIACVVVRDMEIEKLKGKFEEKVSR